MALALQKINCRPVLEAWERSSSHLIGSSLGCRAPAVDLLDFTDLADDRRNILVAYKLREN